MRQKLSLDFVDNQAFSFGHFTPINLLIMSAALFIISYVTLTYNAKNEALDKAQSQLVKLQPLKNTDKAKTQLEKIPADELKYISVVATDLTIPWGKLLTELEQVQMNDIALLSLEPNKKKQQLILGGQAKNMQAALNYIEALEKLPVLSQVFLQKHSVDQIDPFKPVAFTIVAQWS